MHIIIIIIIITLCCVDILGSFAYKQYVMSVKYVLEHFRIL